MLVENYASQAMENLEFICYMSDMDTYELVYLNKIARESFNTGDEYFGKKCYKILQGKDAPCEFCTNHIIEKGITHKWEIHNKLLNNSFSLLDSMSIINGKRIRIEVAFDITEKQEQYNKLEAELTMEKTLIACAQTLTQAYGINNAINNLLEIICEYYSAERAYIFELDWQSDSINNTYEHCVDGISAEITNLQNIPVANVTDWFEAFMEKGEFFISTLDEHYNKDDQTYKILQRQGINSLLAAPLLMDGEILGFIGVDNPKCSHEDLDLLRSIALFVLDDLNKRKIYKDLETLSYVDGLTGVYNRNKYLETLKQYEALPPNSLGVVYADINGLKQANDTYGHLYGDIIITNCAKTMSKFFGEQVYRVGGDEFVAFCINCSQDTFETVIENLHKYIAEDDSRCMSIGSVWKTGKLNIQEAIAYSDDLMYAEKQNYYKRALGERLNYRNATVKELINEIEKGAFKVYLQAKVDLKTGKFNGAEALIRKFTPDGKMIPPDKFVPQYERDKIIRHIDFFVLEEVCKMLADWIKKGQSLKVSVNFSRITFMEHDMAYEISKICDNFDIPHNLIDIEVTESNDNIDGGLLSQKMIQLIELGFTISLDDFGAEYSNLSMLTKTEFEQIKIDKSLVDKICEDEKNCILIKHIIALIQSMNFPDSLAEGIETLEQYNTLKAIGCGSGQGYYFAKPLPMDKFEEIYLEQVK